MSLSADPRSAYFHVPFCAHRCGYCNFAVVAGRGDLAGDYLKAIEAELNAAASPAREPAAPLETLYFGGGTPSQLSGQQFDRLCDLALAWRPLAGGAEWTVEANPSDVTPDWLARIASRGVTRLSLGGQSFSAAKLALLERDHDAGQLQAAVDWAQRAGLEVCLDLIFAAPGETLDDWLRDVAEAAALNPGHLSTYGLTFEKGTAFWSRRRRGNLVEADEELQRSMYLAAIDRLATAGYEHYEVSNFAKPNRHSRHNTAYWSGKSYFGFGPGAASYIDGVRATNHASTTTYLRRVLAGESPIAESERLEPEQRARERLVFGLRRIAGVELARFAAETGFSAEKLAGKALETFVDERLLERAGDTLRLTRDGLLVSDALWPALL